MASRHSPKPLSESRLRDKYGPPSSVTIQVGSSITPGDERQVSRGRLEQGWQDAVEKFKADTGKDLGSFHGGKDGVLGILQKVYAGSDDDARKRDELWTVMEKALNCIELSGRVAAQVGSIVFQPASICFAALEILIDIPRGFKRLRDDLRELFDQVVNFLPNFQILERVEHYLGFDDELVEKINAVLLAMVDICRLCYNKRRHKLSTVMGNIFLKDDKVQDVLKNFQALTKQQDSLILTIILGVALESKANNLVMHQDVRSINYKLDDMQAFQTDDKNIKADREEIGEIDFAFELNELMVRRPLDSLKKCRNTMLDNTMDVLEMQDSHIDWSRSKAQRQLLFLQGGTGSGRTYLLAALEQAIYYERELLIKDDRKTYVAYYAFDRDDGIIGTNDWTPLRVALKVMAGQIARQSANYAHELSKNLENIKHASEPDDFWCELKLDSFQAPDYSTLYLLFDGLDRLKTSLNYIKRIISPMSSATIQSEKMRRKLRLRIIFTGKKENYDRIGQAMPIMDVEHFNEPLLRSFVERELQNMPQNGLVLKHRAKLTETVLAHAAGSFANASRRFEMIKNAASRNQKIEELLAQIRSNNDADILDGICSKLTSDNQQQLKEILYWAVFGCRWLTVEELEACLFLRHYQEPHERLESKITTNFAPAVNLHGKIIMADSGIEDYIRYSDSGVEDHVLNTDNGLSGSTSPSKISMVVKIENAGESVIKKFFWDVNSTLAVDGFDFAGDLKRNKIATEERLHFSFAEAHYTIAMRCLEVLNDDKIRSKTLPLLRYACGELPNHIYYLNSQNCYELLTVGQRRALGQAMVDFLADEENIDSVWSYVSIPPEPWVYDHENVLAIGKFLTNPLILHERSPRDRRAAEKMTKQSPEDPVPFLRDLAIVAASRWLDKRKAVEGQEKDCFHLVNAYLRLLGTDADLPQFRSKPDSSVSIKALDENSDQEAEAEAVAQARKEPSSKNTLPEDTHTVDGKSSTTVSSTETRGDVLCDQPHPSQEMIRFGSDDSAEEVDSELSFGKADGGLKSAKSSKRDRKTGTREVHVDSGIDSGPAFASDNPLEPRRITGYRVKEALNWSLGKIQITVDYFVLQRLGYTLLHQDNAAAIVYFKQAYNSTPPDDFGGRLKVACALADAHARDKTAEAYDALKPAIEEFLNLREGKTFSEHEKSWLFTTFTKAASYMMDMQKDVDAVSMYKEAVVYSPNIGSCRPELIGLLCKTDQSTQAQEFFDQWTKVSVVDKRYGPQAHLIRLAREGQKSRLSTFFHSIRRAPLRTRIIQVLTDAIEDDGDIPEYADKSALHFARGLALAITRDEEELRAAMDEWKACLHTHASSTDAGPDDLRADSWTWAAQYHFDLHKRRLLEHPQMSISEKQTLCRQLQDNIKDLQPSADIIVSVTDSPWSYVAAFAKLAGLDSYARDILQPDMKMAIRILCDDDPENDSYGLMLLLSVLRCYGDIHGTHSVWSLFDRSRLADKRERSWAAQPTNDSSKANNTSPQPELDLRDDDSQPNDQDVPKTAGVIKTYCELICDGCDTEMYSFEEQEIWSCRFCPNADFCRGCYVKLKNKDLDRVVCSHDHEHVLWQHFDYEREEVQGQKVRINWDFAEDDKNGGKQWKGGDIVQLNDWIGGLEHDWGIERAGQSKGQ